MVDIIVDIIVIAVFTLIIRYIINERKKKKLVLKYGKNINALLEINKKYSFYPLNRQHYIMLYQVNSKRNLEKTTFNEVIRSYIDGNINNIRSDIESTIKNIETYNNYLNEINKLNYYMDNDFFVKNKIEPNEFYRIERNMMVDYRIKNRFFLDAKIYIQYITPKAQRFYQKEYYSSFNELEFIYNQWKEKQNPFFKMDTYNSSSNTLNVNYQNYNSINNTNINIFLTGIFYDENNIINDKYRYLKTPNYILVQINEQLHPIGNYHYSDDLIIMSDRYKDKYLNSADFFPFNSYWAKMSDLNEYQLKWYLYWRKEFLNGNVLDTDISYIFIFAYELISYTFNKNAPFNISALEKLYNSYKELFPKLDNYLPEWIADMLSEVGYFYNLDNDNLDLIEDDSLVNSLTTLNELDKININVWKKHYDESKSELTNKQLSLLQGNQKFNNRFKKYSGLLAKYYIDNGIDITQKWFEIKVVIEKKNLFNGVPCSLQRMEGTYKYKKYCSNEAFNNDLNQITKLCYDLVFPESNINENDYVINKYKNGSYDLPSDYFYSCFKSKNKKDEPKLNEEINEKKEFTIDFSKINNELAKVDYIESSKEVINFESDEKEFIDKFVNNKFDKKEAQLYCLKKGILLNAYITNLNEKYYSVIHKELIIIEDDVLKLNIEMGDNNDRK